MPFFSLIVVVFSFLCRPGLQEKQHVDTFLWETQAAGSLLPALHPQAVLCHLYDVTLAEVRLGSSTKSANYWTCCRQGSWCSTNTDIPLKYMKTWGFYLNKESCKCFPPFVSQCITECNRIHQALVTGFIICYTVNLYIIFCTHFMSFSLTQKGVFDRFPSKEPVEHIARHVFIILKSWISWKLPWREQNFLHIQIRVIH